MCTSVKNHINKYGLENLSGSYCQKLQSYNDEFFQNKKIIVIYHEEITASSTISVKNIEFSGDKANVILDRKVPNISNTAMKDYVIIIEIPQNEKCVSATYEFV